MNVEKFDNLFFFAPKSKIKAGDGLKKGRFPFYSSSPIQSKWIDNEQYFDEALIFGTGGIPSIHFSNEPFSTSTDCLVAIAKKEKAFNIKYVYYYIYSNIRILEKGFRGAGIKHISKTYIENLEIELPDLDTQDKIVAVLDKVKNLIKKRKETIELFNQLLKATFLNMFGEPLKNVKGFNLTNIENISTAIKDGPHVSPKYSEKGIPLLSTRNVRPGRFIFDDLKFISQETYENLTKHFQPQKGDVLITKGGTTGYAKVIDLDFDISIWVHLAVVRLKKEINPYYFESFINSDYGYFQTQRYTQGIANKDLGLKKIAKIELLLPPIELQEKYAKIYIKINDSISKLENSIDKLEDLLKGLSQSAFNGTLKFNTSVELEVLLENDYDFFKRNADKKTIQLLLDRMDKNILNKNKFYEEELYNKAKMFIFNLLENNKIEQVYEQERIKLVVK